MSCCRGVRAVLLVAGLSSGFPAGVATGENHIWLYKSELP
jgi:hypothetical protein